MAFTYQPELPLRDPPYYNFVCVILTFPLFLYFSFRLCLQMQRICTSLSTQVFHRLGSGIFSHLSSPALSQVSLRSFASSSFTAFSSTPSRFALNMSSVSAAEEPAKDKAVYEDFQITDDCVKHLQSLMKQHGKGTILRLLVDTGGCSGYQYLFNLEHVEPEDKYIRGWADGKSPRVFIDGEDYVFQRDGITVLVDDVSFPFIKGAKMDYKSEMIRSAFAVVDNPNVDLACGCGTSFAKKG